MVASVNIHRSKGNVSVQFSCFVGKLTSLSSLFLAPHNKLQSFATNWFDGFYGSRKSKKLGL